MDCITLFLQSYFEEKATNEGRAPQNFQETDGFDSDSLFLPFSSFSSISLTKSEIALSNPLFQNSGVQMEKENKRKGCERNCDQEARRRKKLKGEDEEKDVLATDEEVDEFFAILRRMKAAIEYFSKGNNNNKNGEGWRAVEAEVAATVAVVGGVKKEEQEMKVPGEDAVEQIDLNAVPEGDVNEES